MNFVARLLVFAAAWTATEPYSLIPGEGPGGGAGRVTPLSADTEPVLAVAPPPPPGELIPEGPVPAPDQPAQGKRTPPPVGAARPAEIYAERRRSFAVGAAIGGAAGALLANRHRGTFAASSQPNVPRSRNRIFRRVGRAPATRGWRGPDPPARPPGMVCLPPPASRNAV
jgi:hypothetical protein